MHITSLSYHEELMMYYNKFIYLFIFFAHKLSNSFKKVYSPPHQALKFFEGQNYCMCDHVNIVGNLLLSQQNLLTPNKTFENAPSASSC